MYIYVCIVYVHICMYCICIYARKRNKNVHPFYWGRTVRTEDVQWGWHWGLTLRTAIEDAHWRRKLRTLSEDAHWGRILRTHIEDANWGRILRPQLRTHSEDAHWGCTLELKKCDIHTNIKKKYPSFIYNQVLEIFLFCHFQQFIF